ncbi:MAG: formate dehydrogenase accessory sulfurtransferase FdhD [Deltaproteobacteria bacterium]|nr:formate dehydrogenase accessory sulfurtransferase FdhD [Deltaproteobacteria bacterium]
MSQSVKDHYAVQWRAGTVVRERDQLAVEEPLEIRLGGRRFTLTMRTPGHDEELAAGFLLAEGFINARQEIGDIRRLRDSHGRPEPNALDIILNVPAAALRERLQRNFSISSSCGVCGKTSIEALERRIPPLTSNARITADALFKMPALMRQAQAVFSATGGLHAAALFEFYSTWAAPCSETAGRRVTQEDVRLVALREDVGRHNAVDKVTGYALLQDNIPIRDAASGGAEQSLRLECVPRSYAMMVSGRLSFEIVQKVAAAGIAILCAVSAPSSLAVELAEEVGMTLVGFLREPNLNIYSAPERIVLIGASAAVNSIKPSKSDGRL